MTKSKNRFKVSLPEKIADELRRNIIQNVIPKGKHLNEVVLSESYGVSRGSIRQAIMLLANEGLVEILSNGRALVHGFGKSEINDYFMLRLYIEQDAVRKIMSLPDDANFQKMLRRLNDIADELAAAPDYIVTEHSSHLDMEFHYEIVSFACSQISRQVWMMLSNIYRTIRTINSTHPETHRFTDLDSSKTSHQKIVEMLTSRDEEGLLHELEWHLKGNIANYSAILESFSDNVIPQEDR